MGERLAYRIARQSRATQRRQRRRIERMQEAEGAVLERAQVHGAWGRPNLHRSCAKNGVESTTSEPSGCIGSMACRFGAVAVAPRAGRARCPVDADSLDAGWSMDLMGDSLADGRAYRTSNVIDDYARDALAIEIDISLVANRVVCVLDRLCERCDTLEAIRTDDGPEFRSDRRRRGRRTKASAGTSSSRAVRHRKRASGASTAPTDWKFSMRISSAN